jgi:hypothetical protein
MYLSDQDARPRDPLGRDEDDPDNLGGLDTEIPMPDPAGGISDGWEPCPF